MSDEKISAVVVTLDDSRTEGLRAVLAELEGFDVHVEAAKFDDCIAKVKQLAADVAVVFLDDQPSSGCAILEQIKRTRDNVFAFAVSNERSAEVIVKAIRSGADELLSATPTKEELFKALVKIVERRRQAPSSHVLKTKTITVHSPHGGVGVTTLATNLAIALRKLSGQEVVLVDLDLQHAETPVFLNFKPLYSILDVSKGIDNLDPAFLKGALYAHSSGIFVLAPPANLEDSESITASDIEKILATLRMMFDFIILDTANHLNDINLVALESADSVYLVCDNMVPSVRALKRSMDSLARLGIDEGAFNLVLNKPAPKSEINAKDVSEALKHGVAQTLPFDEITAVAAANQGKPLFEVNPRSPLADAILGIAKAEAGVAEEGQGKGLFGRFFSEARP